MRAYIRVEELACARRGCWHPVFLGELKLRLPAPVGNYVLIDLASQRVAAKLDHYPNWTETGLCLCTRLLLRSEPLLTCPPTSLMVTFGFGPSASCALSREVLRIDAKAHSVRADLISPIGLFSDLHVNPPPNHTVQALISAALAAALHRTSFPSPLPRPLTHVPIQKRGDGSQYVRLEDVPPLSKYYLRSALRLDADCSEIEYPAWMAFISTI